MRLYEHELLLRERGRKRERKIGVRSAPLKSSEISRRELSTRHGAIIIVVQIWPPPPPQKYDGFGIGSNSRSDIAPS